MTKAVETPGHQFVAARALQTSEGGFEFSPEQSSCFRRIAMSSSRGFWHDGVDNSLPENLRGGQAELRCCLLDMVCVAPEDGSTSLGRDHGIDGMFLHQDNIPDTEGQGAAAPTLADQDHHDRGPETEQLKDVLGDGLDLLGREVGKKAHRQAVVGLGGQAGKTANYR